LRFKESVEEARVVARPGGVRLTEGGLVAADLTISDGGAVVNYMVYLSEKSIVLLFGSPNPSRAELAARLLKRAGVDAEVAGDGGVWWVKASTDMLAAGHERLRKALAEIVKTAFARGWVDARRAELWLKKLGGGRVLKEGWPEYHVWLIEGALVIKSRSTDADSIEREAQRLREMGLEEGVHFTVKMPKGGREGYVSILKKGFERAAWLSKYGSGEQRKLAAEFVDHILKRAMKKGGAVYEKAKKIVEKVKARGSLRLAGVRRVEVEVRGRTYVVKVVGLSGELVESQGGKLLLRIKITAEVDGVLREYVITYGRYGKLNVVLGFARARADAPGGREADAERLTAVIKALTGKEPLISQGSDSTIKAVCVREHLDGFARYAELADAIERWLEETSRR
jgi:hypothetical protein